MGQSRTGVRHALEEQGDTHNEAHSTLSVTLLCTWRYLRASTPSRVGSDETDSAVGAYLEQLAEELAAEGIELAGADGVLTAEGAMQVATTPMLEDARAWGPDLT